MKQYQVQALFQEFGEWMCVSVAAGMVVPYMTTLEEANEFFAILKQSPNAEGHKYRLVVRTVSPWEVVGGEEA